jgi:hypothetical protein
MSRTLTVVAAAFAFALSLTPHLAGQVGQVGQNLSWSRQFGTNRVDQATGVVVIDGSVYVVGDVIGALPGQTSVGPNDRNAFIRRYDPDGKELWTRQLGATTAAHDSATGITASGLAIYVAGWTGGALPGQAKTGPQDNAFVARYNVEGDLVWTRQFGTQSAVQALGVAADASGVYVAGSIDCCGSPFPNIPASNGADAYLRKYDPEGNELWTRQFGSSDSDRATAVAVDGSGVYVLGVTGGVMATRAGLQDGFLRKYDSGGAEGWTIQFGTDKADEPNAIALAPSGIYVGGRTTGTYIGEPAIGLWDNVVLQFDRDGRQQWVRQFGGRDADNVFGLAVGLSALLVTGAADGPLPGQKWVGAQDAFYRTYSFAGDELSTREFGGGFNDYGTAAAADARGFYVVGSNNGTALGLPSVGDNDAFVLKLANRLEKDEVQPGPAPRRGGPPAPGRRGGRAGGGQ